MKKLIVFVLCLLLLGACSRGKTSSNQKEKDPLEFLYGIWEVSKVNIDGSDYSVKELEEMGNDSCSEKYLLFKEGGGVYSYSALEDKGVNDKWTYDEENKEVIFTNGVLEYDGYYLVFETDIGSLYFKRYSLSQDITRIPKHKEEKEIKEENVTQKAEEKVEEKAEEKQEEVTNNNTIRADVKDAIDSYEKFIDQYCEFMTKYTNSSSTDFSMLADYAKFMSKLVEMEEKMDALENDLNDVETLYYAEVMLRCSQKLLNAAS